MDERAPGTVLSRMPNTWPLTARETAALLGVHERTIRRAISCGALPAIKRAGAYRIAPADIAVWRARIRGGGPPRIPSFLDQGASGASALPHPRTPMIGRAREGSEVFEALLLRDVRLITLTGPGGVGKTRLALHLADRLVNDGAGAVYFVALDRVTEPALMLPTIGRAIGVREGGGRPLLHRIAARLADERSFLILDTFEHLLAAADDVSRLLARCDRLRVIVTSRAILRISGERVIPVPPLTPPSAAADAPTDVLTFEAVQLFVARASAIQSEFTLTRHNAPAVAEIVRRLDGLPLAIELAAAHSRALSPQALLAQLDPILPVLTRGARDQPARLQTMRGAIAWSYDLLHPEERALFRRCAAFSGGFTLAAAAALMGDAARTRPPASTIHAGAPSILDLLEALVDHSLLQRRDEAGDDPRFVMLDTIRAYGHDQLLVAGEEQRARENHACYFLKQAEEKWPTFYAQTMDDWLRRLDAELPNLRLALGWFQSSGQSEAFLRLAVALRELCFVRGYAREGSAWLTAALAAAEHAPEPLRAMGRLVHGELLLLHGGHVEAERSLLACLALSRARGDSLMATYALNALGMAAADAGDYDRSETRLRAGLALVRARDEAERTNERVGTGAAVTGFLLFNLGMAAMAQGDFAHAKERFEAALEVQRTHGDLWATGVVLWALGNVFLDRGNERQALVYYRESLARARDFGDKQLMSHAFASIGGVVLSRKQPETAASLFGAAEALRDALGSKSRPEYERHVLAVQSALDAETLARRWGDGRRLPLDDALALAFAAASPPRDQSPGARDATITRRERDVLRLLVEGRTDREMAEALSLSPRTVEWHRTNLFNKFGVSTRTALAAVTIKNQLL